MEKLQKELQMWQEVKTSLTSVPKDHRSQYHTQYLNEVEQRIYDCKCLIENL